MPVPKYKLGDKVKLGGQPGEVVTASAHQETLPDGSKSFLYGVRLQPWPKVVKTYLAADGEELNKTFYEHPVTKERRDHEADSLGCIPEKALE